MSYIKIYALLSAESKNLANYANKQTVSLVLDLNLNGLTLCSQLVRLEAFIIS